MNDIDSSLGGVLAPVVTPFKEDYTPDAQRLAAHCNWLTAQDCGLAVFGTNSEANSLSVDERIDLLETLVDAGVDCRRLLPGTGCCSIVDSIRLTRHAVDLGCAGVLMLPPFYYKGVPDEGIYRNFSTIIESVGRDNLRIYLYHFPALSGVPFGIDLIARLREAFPEIVVGMKDSSGDPENLEAVLKAFPGFRLYAGNETLLLRNMHLGGVGCISATANVNPRGIVELYNRWREDDADALQGNLNAVRETFQRFPLIASMKSMLAHYGKDSAWNRLRPPLVELSRAETSNLWESLADLGFDMPGLGVSSAAS